MTEEIKASDWNCYHLSHLTDYYLTLKHNILPSIHKQINATVSIIFITLECLQHQRVLLSHFYSSASYKVIIMANATFLVYHFL